MKAQGKGEGAEFVVMVFDFPSNYFIYRDPAFQESG